MFDKMKQLYDMQRQARELQKQLETIRIEKSSKDGLLKISVNGAQKLESVAIDRSWLAPEKKEALERALCNLVNEGFGEVQKQAAAQAAGLLKGFPDLPGV